MTTVEMDDADVIIVRRYWEFKHHASSLNSHACHVRRVPVTPYKSKQ
jgi:hypothetical protein